METEICWAGPDAASGIAAIRRLAWPGEESDIDRIARLRWELDLMAVHPDHRGRGLGARLVQTATRVGFEAGASLVRGLIRIDNQASQRVFLRCSFQPDSEERTLLVAPPGPPGSPVRAYAGRWRVVPVCTFTYRGWWLEPGGAGRGNPSGSDTLASTPDLVGAALPSEDREHREAALAAGFRAVGRFHWWHRRRAPFPGREE